MFGIITFLKNLRIGLAYFSAFFLKGNKMSFIVQDVEKHKKGLSDSQKKQWVAVANSALKKWSEDYKGVCVADAIKQANGSVKDFKHIQTFNIQDIEIFSTGVWNGDKYTSKDLDQIVDSFDKVGFDPPLKLGHDENKRDGQPKFGIITALKRAGEKILADFSEIPQALYEAMKRKNYDRVSSEIYFNYSEKGKILPRVLKAVALLGADIPAVTNLEAIAGLYNQDSSHTKWVRYEFDKNFRQEATMHNDGDEARKREIKEYKEKLKAAEEKGKKFSDENDLLKDANKELEENKKDVTARLMKQEEISKAKNIENTVEKLKIEGKVLPKFERELKKLMQSANTETKVYCYTETKDAKETSIELTQMEMIEKIFSNMPKLVHFKELSIDKGENNEDYTDPGVEVDRRTKEYMKEKSLKSYSEACKVVLSRDEKLKNAYVGTSN